MALWPPFSPLPDLYFSKPLLVTFTPNPTTSLNEIQSNKAPDLRIQCSSLFLCFQKTISYTQNKIKKKS